MRIAVFVMVIMVMCLCPGRSSNECCKYKSVDNSGYGLIGTENTAAFNCKNDCVYTRYGEPNSRYCFTTGGMTPSCFPEEDSCFHHAVTVGTNDCSADCASGSESSCNACFTDKIGGECVTELTKSTSLTCVLEVPECIYKCRNVNPIKLILCTIECIPKDCEKDLCYYVGKFNPAFKAICTCIAVDGLVGIAGECRKENPDSLVGTVECVIAKTPVDCISSICSILEYAFPEFPEIIPICTCGTEIVVAVDKCYAVHKPNWEQIVECTIETAAKDCAKYICKIAGKIFPPILETKFCKN